MRQADYVFAHTSAINGSHCYLENEQVLLLTLTVLQKQVQV